jgi:HAD superfamily hydrolase (TIGR01509 family)
MSELRPGVLFDVDGTLVDTNYLHTLAWSRALRDAGEWAPMNAIHRLIGATQLLRALHGRGVVVVLATSSPGEELEVLRDVLDADGAIDGQTNADDVDDSKPAPEVFSTAMRTFSIDPSRAVAVGDSVWDVQAARAAGIGCVAVETGGFSQHELGEAGAIRVYRDVQEILDQFFTGPLELLCAGR